MNLATVRRASAGLAYLALYPSSTDTGVAIGCDARHGSQRFAEQTARSFGAGFRRFRLPGQLPTPLFAFAVRHLTCAAGVMITASHNPPQDNGYKVTWATAPRSSRPPTTTHLHRHRPSRPAGPSPLGGLGEPAGVDIVDDYLAAIIAALPPSGAMTSTRCTRPFTVSAATCCLPGSPSPGSPRLTWWPPRASPTPTSRRFPNQTPKKPAPSTWPSPGPRRWRRSGARQRPRCGPAGGSHP